MDNSINFKGAFWLHQPSAKIKNNILPTLGKHRQIFNNFTPEGDVLYITRKGADKNVAEFLMKLIEEQKNKKKKTTKFEYYTDLTTKSGFDQEKPKEAIHIIENYKSKVITTIKELKDFFKLGNGIKLAFSTNKKDNTLEKSLRALDLNPIDYVIKRKNGFNEIYTKDKSLVASISEPGQYGFRYARVEPQIAGDEVKRYAIRDGEIQFTYLNNPDETVVNGTTTFLKNYMKAVNANKITHNAVHQ